MKRFVSFTLVVLFVIISTCGVVAAQGLPSTSASSVALYDCDTEQFLYSSSSQTRRGMASTTKIMTALVVLEKCKDLTCKVKVPKCAVGIEGTSMYLKLGDVLTVKDLLMGLMLTSGNDAAYTLAIGVGGSVSAFAKLMNDKAKELSLTDTHFTNPAGLTDKNHYSTASDMALLTSVALKCKEFVTICSSSSYTVHFLNSGREETVYNHNRLLSEIPGCVGVKTGFTEKAGRCLVSAVRESGHTLVCVTLSDPNDWLDHKNLYKWAFSGYVSFPVHYTGSVKVVGAKREQVRVNCKSSFDIHTSLSSKISVRVNLPQFVYAPVKRSDKLGTVDIILGNRVLYSADITAISNCSIREVKLPLFQRIVNCFGRLFDEGFIS